MKAANKIEGRYCNIPCTLFGGILSAGARQTAAENLLRFGIHARHIDLLEINYGETYETTRQIQDEFKQLVDLDEINKILDSVDEFEAMRTQDNGKRVPLFGLKYGLLFDIVRGKCSGEELHKRLIYMAMRSIVGNKPYIKTNWRSVLARASGSIRYSGEGSVSPELMKYLNNTNTRPRQKVLKILTDPKTYKLKYFANVRGIYISFLEDIDLAAIAKRRKE